MIGLPKTTTLNSNRRLLGPAHEWWSWVGVLCLLGLMEFVGLAQPLRAGLERFVAPSLHLSSQVVPSVTTPWKLARAAYNSQRRIQDLELRYAEATASVSDLDGLRRENEALKQLLQVSQPSETQRVITTPILSYGRPLISSGSQQGVRSGAMVLVAQTLVGLVVNTSENQAEVTLLSQETSQPLLAVTETGITGLVKGDGKRVLLTELPTTSKPQIGERVVTQGQVGIERNVSLGRIIQLESDPSSSSQTAIIEQYVSFYDTAIVEVR